MLATCIFNLVFQGDLLAPFRACSRGAEISETTQSGPQQVGIEGAYLNVIMVKYNRPTAHHTQRAKTKMCSLKIWNMKDMSSFTLIINIVLKIPTTTTTTRQEEIKDIQIGKEIVKL